MSDKHLEPHPNSPSGGGGPGAFRHSGPIGVNQHHWAGHPGHSSEPDVLNIRVPPELAEHSDWMSGSDSKKIAEHSGHGVAAKIAAYQIIVVYDPKTSQGTFYLMGASGKDSKTVLQANVVVGGQDHVTPTGDFHASFWETDHVSKQYGWKADTAWSKSVMGLNAFGPYQLHIRELEKRGIYIHGTMGPSWSHTTAISGIAVSQSSHGCVRMSNADVLALHNLIPEPQGIPIKITTKPDDAPKK